MNSKYGGFNTRNRSKIVARADARAMYIYPIHIKMKICNCFTITCIIRGNRVVGEDSSGVICSARKNYRAIKNI